MYLTLQKEGFHGILNFALSLMANLLNIKLCLSLYFEESLSESLSLIEIQE